MTSAPSPLTEPPCPPAPGEVDDGPSAASGASVGALRAVRRRFDDIARSTWDDLAAATPAATPFSRWAFQRAWWDAYGANAHEQTLVVVPAGAPDDADPVAIVPLMHRHEVEPDDELLRTHMRAADRPPLTLVPPNRKAVFFGASYHADYATVLARPADLSAVSDALARALLDPASTRTSHLAPWDVVDLRRLRHDDPAVPALCDGLQRVSASGGWRVVQEPEDVCPVLELPAGIDYEGYLGTLGRKERHEVRRKVRRAESAGEVRLERSADPSTDLGSFVDLHQRRWGDQGLFPDTPGGAQSRTFFRGLFERCSPDGSLALRFVTVGGRRIAAGVWFDDGRTIYFYNAGTDPDARELSPGVLLVALALQDALAAGRTTFDFLRGDEPYKYEWGAVDRPICRLLVAREPR